jgi:hypothetical protein
MVNYSLNIVMGATAASSVYGAIFRNNTTPYYAVWTQSDLANSKEYTAVGSALIECNAGDTLRVICDSTGQNITLDAGVSGNESTYVNIHRLSGPATIAANEFVCAKATGVPTGTITGSVGTCTTVIFPTEEFDTHGAYNPSTGEFTVPVAGYYRITAFVSVSSTEVVDTYALIAFRKNAGSFQYCATRITATGLTSVYVTGSNITKCVAGDVLTIRVSSGSTSPVFEVGETGQYIIFEKVDK